MTSGSRVAKLFFLLAQLFSRSFGRLNLVVEFLEIRQPAFDIFDLKEKISLEYMIPNLDSVIDIASELTLFTHSQIKCLMFSLNYKQLIYLLN